MAKNMLEIKQVNQVYLLLESELNGYSAGILGYIYGCKLTTINVSKVDLSYRYNA